MIRCRTQGAADVQEQQRGTQTELSDVRKDLGVENKKLEDPGSAEHKMPEKS